MKTFLSCFVSILIFSQLNYLNAQYQLGEKWVAIYNPSGYQAAANSVAVDNAGNVYVTGLAVYNSNDGRDYATVKYNSAGVQQWYQRYDWTGNHDEGISVAVDLSGNVYVAGYASSAGTLEDYVTIKYNSSGVQQWLLRYQGVTTGSNEVPKDMALDGSGNVYVTGGSGGDYATVKYYSSGSLAWSQRYNAGNIDIAYSIAVDASGNVYVTGMSWGSGSYDYVTIKYNSSGVQQWVQRYNGSGNSSDAAYAIAVDGTGNVYVTGGSTGSSNGVNYVTIKYNASGVQQWISEYIWFNTDIAYDIALGSDGSVYVTGASAGSTADDDDIYTMKVSSSGSTIWGNRYIGPGTDDDVANSIVVDNGGNVYVSGYSFGGSSYYDYVLLRYSTSGGNPLTVKRYNGSGSDISYDMASDVNGCIYLTGTSNSDYCTIKYIPVPVTPMLVSPANNSTGISCTPLLNWNDVVNAENYSVQVSISPTFNTFVVNQFNLTSSQYQIPSNTLQNNVLYYWRANALNSAGTGPWSTVWSFRTALVGIQPISSEIPDVYQLYSNSPNPFNPSTDIRFDIPKSGLVILKVFDVFGEEMESLVNERLEPGKYKAVFDGSSFSSGVYFYQLVTDEYTSTSKMVLVK